MSVIARPHFFWQDPLWPQLIIDNRWSRGRSNRVCLIVGSSTREEFVTKADFQSSCQWLGVGAGFVACFSWGVVWWIKNERCHCSSFLQCLDAVGWMIAEAFSYPPHTTTVLRPFFRDHPGDPVPEENFWTLWCKGRLTEADTLTIRLGATPSGLTSAHLHHPHHSFYRPDALPAAQPMASKHWRQLSRNVIFWDPMLQGISRLIE